MNFLKRLSPIPLLLVTVLPITLCGEENANPQAEEGSPSENRGYNDLARYLAGLTPEEGSTLAKFEQKADAQQHRKFFEKSWATVEKTLVKMRPWAKENLADDGKHTIFYPFGGPDFLNAHTLFPNAKEYILFGLEPPGRPPQVDKLTASQATALLTSTQKSMSSILNYSFFQTLHMKEDLKQTELNGVSPVLLVFLARTGHRILDVKRVELLPSGELKKYPSETVKKWEGVPGIEIAFRREDDSTRRTLTFYSLDISDKAVPQYYLTYLKGLGPFKSYLKAASYLMHRDNFSKIRTFILTESDLILEDDSGIPLTYFDKNVFDLTFFGAYTRPIALFESRYQKDLREVYKDKANVKPLPFGIGYKWREGESNLLLATKKN